MRFFIITLLFYFYFISLSFAQVVDPLSTFAQVDKQIEESEMDDLEYDDQDFLNDEQDFLNDDIVPDVKTPNELYFDFDLGIPIIFFPHGSLWRAYKDADWHYNSIRGATSITLNRFRFELGYLKANYNEGEPGINSYGGKSITTSKSKMTLEQREVLFFWLRNDPSRISFIGGGSVFLTVDEKLTLDYISGNQTHSITTKERDKVRGYKLVVGSKDIDSSLKTTFSYTSAFIETKTGKRYDLGGFAFTFSLSFSGL
jgi:hypothetical protein